MIGNAQEAEFIRDWYVKDQEKPREERSEGAPEGWERLGSGCYRVAFLGPSGAVYKVQQRYPKHLNDYYGQSNAGEAATLRRLMFRKLPRGCRFPRYQLFELDGRTVIAMEKFDKLLKDYSSYSDEGRLYYDLQRHLVSALSELWDFHGGNLAVDEANKQLVPIDLGGSQD